MGGEFNKNVFGLLLFAQMKRSISHPGTYSFDRYVSKRNTRIFFFYLHVKKTFIIHIKNNPSISLEIYVCGRL